MKVRFKKLYENSILPSKAHETDAGFDLYANSFHTIDKSGNGKITDAGNIFAFRLYPGERVLVKCGFSMALPNGYEAQIRPRSGMALKYGIGVVNSPGTIDSSWRGECGVILINFSEVCHEIILHERIAQMVINKLPDVEIVEVDSLDETDRGENGFGSSGRG